MLWRAGVGLLLLPLVAAAEVCPKGDDACTDSEHSALLQQPRRPGRPASLTATGGEKRATTPIVHMRRASTPHVFDTIPKTPDKAQSRKLCDDVDSILSTDPEVVEAKMLWNFACSDKFRDKLHQLRKGCLYVPTNKHLTTFFKEVEHANPWGFLPMWADSFVEMEGKDCPTDGMEVTRTVANSEVTPCLNTSAFTATDGGCVPATLIGTSKKSKIKVMKLDGLMGMDATWEKIMSHAHENTVRENAFEENKKVLLEQSKATIRRGKTASSGRSETQSWSMNIKYVLCDGTFVDANNQVQNKSFIRNYVTDQMLAAQTEALNRAFSGQDTCAGGTSYSTQQVNTGLQFVSLGRQEINSEFCNYDCFQNRPNFYQIVPLEPGVTKVLICDTSLLGFASFPYWPDQWRMLIVHPGTLPGGYVTNYNFGDTLTHEMGHYLGLQHTFTGGCSDGDMVGDTSPEAYAYFGCSSTPRRTCSATVEDPIHNFMDYADDQCMCSFTQDQVQEIWHELSLYRPELLPP